MGRARLLNGLVGVGIAGAVVLVGPAAAAEDGLDETARSRFVLEGDGSPVEASVTVTIRNDQPDRGGYFYYWDQYGIPVPAGAEDVRATSGGSDLTVTFEDTEDPGTTVATASFSPLNYGRSRTIEWTYSVPGDPVRSEGYTRVGDGYATFAVQGVGEPGQVSVEVELPSSMVFDSTTDAFTPSEDGATVTWTADENTEDQGIWAVVSARDPEASDARELEVGDDTLTLEGFPGDDEWLDFVEAQVTEGMPVLEETVGHPWPGGLDVIREDVSPQVLGYAWFDPDTNEIIVPEDLDEGLLFHELTHAWLDPQHIRERWLYEGLTEVVAEHVVDRTGGSFDARETPDRDSDAAVPLSRWTEPTERAGEVDEYGYAASYAVLTRLLGDLDDETFTEIVSAAYTGESAYEEPGASEKNGGRTDWKRFLDLVEVRGGVDDATDVFRAWVLDDADDALLDTRSAALATYTALDETDAAWQTPFGLRSAMTHWLYTEADETVAALGDAPADAAAVQSAAAAAGLPVPAAVQAAYESADEDEDYAAVAVLLPQAVDVVGRVGEASDAAAAPRDPVSGLGAGVLGVDGAAADARAALAAGELDDAAALADGASQRAGLATWVGAGSIVLVVLLLAGAGLGVRALVRRRRRAGDAQNPDSPADPDSPAADHDPVPVPDRTARALPPTPS
ncbi:hypothetical protein IF650_07470 [Cellulosimicrobium terreum]|nr:hypothetical protein [Cellulosimicrobium terreum]